MQVRRPVEYHYIDYFAHFLIGEPVGTIEDIENIIDHYARD